MSELFGAVETGGTWCVCALGRGSGELVAREQFPTGSPPETIERIVAFFSGHPRPRAVGIGSFGPVDLDRASPTWGHVTSTPKPGWRHVPLAPEIAERLNLPVAFETDVTAAALGERRWGAGRGASSLCYVTVGTGIGAGLLIDGRPVHGLVHPEVGHLRVPHDRQRDPFPGSCPAHHDCWEGLAAGGAIAGRWGVPGDRLPDEHPAWELESEYLALGLLAIVCIASPERVILGGGIMERAGLRERVASRLVELNAGYLDHPMLGSDVNRYVVAPELGDNAGVLGALALARDAV